MRIVIGIDHTHDRDAELFGFGDGALVVAHINHEHGIGYALHILDTTQTAVQFFQLALNVE